MVLKLRRSSNAAHGTQQLQATEMEEVLSGQRQSHLPDVCCGARGKEA